MSLGRLTMAKPGFLVEGHMESTLIQQLCPNAPVMRIGNGDAMTMTAMAKHAAKLIRLMKHARPCVIIFDRENRPSSCEDLKQELYKNLKEKNVSHEVIICVCDRTIENWILLSWDEIKNKNPDLNLSELNLNPKGKHGKKTLKILLPRGVIYHEVTMGVKMLSEINVKKVYENCDQFKNLADSIGIQCRFLNPISAPAP